MTALRLGVLFAVVAAAFTQYGSQFGGYYGQPSFGFGGQLGSGSFGFGSSPYGVGFQAGAAGMGGPVSVAPLGYDPFYSNIQQQQIYAVNLGYDQTSSAGANCVNGVRMSDGRCMCQPGFKGADCGVPPPELALNSKQGVVCRMTPGDPLAVAEQQSRIQSEGPLGQMKMQLESMMSGSPGGLLTGPGFGNQFCPLVPNRGLMAPVHLKSAVTDYGYVVCSENQLCYNKVCAPCTMFNPSVGGCVEITDSARRNLPGCNVRAGEAPYEVKTQWYAATLQNPKISAEAGMMGPMGGAPIGNVPFNPPVGRTFG